MKNKKYIPSGLEQLSFKEGQQAMKEHIIKIINKQPTEFPEIESNDFDLGALIFKFIKRTKMTKEQFYDIVEN